MRSFIAAELPGEVVEALAETSARLRGCVHGRYVAPDSFHITLAFLGNLENAQIDQAVEALDEACRAFTRFDISLGEFGSFGRKKKSTLWQGLREPGMLDDLSCRVRGNLKELGIPYDDKPFRAHVTLMRSADLSSGSLPSPVYASGTVEAISLFSSDLSGERPVYDAVHSVELMASPLFRD